MYTQLLASLPSGGGQRVDLRGCDLSGLHFPFHTVERAELGGAYVGAAKHSFLHVWPSTCSFDLNIYTRSSCGAR